jgi:circadian clock protein KaiC
MAYGAIQGTATSGNLVHLAKTPTGIAGFDDLTRGGLPRGRSTLVTGASGSGKTLFGVEFLARGARDLGEPGVMLTFEESSREIAENVASLGFDLPGLEREGLLVVDGVRLDPAEIVETGAFDLDGLFIRLSSAIDAVGAKRVVLDTVEVLFSALSDKSIIRSELSRMLRWLKDRGLTTLVTGERGHPHSLTRFGIEEYVSDCVICLDHRVHDDISTRRLRVVKYRGSEHGTNEYPFLITDQGIRILPITSVSLDYDAADDMVSTGVARLDEMTAGGVYRGSTVLVTGSPGTGKTTLAAHLVDAACARGERAVFISFEESPKQVLRNMRSVGVDLARWVDAGLLRLAAQRPTALGLEAHLGSLHRVLEEAAPTTVVLDDVGGLMGLGPAFEVASAIAREIDLMKSGGITGIVTAVTSEGDERTDGLGISSLTDTWLLLRNVESDGERNRLLSVIKSRGIAHSNQVREFVLTDHGIRLLDVRGGPRGILTGSARAAAPAAGPGGTDRT